MLLRLMLGGSSEQATAIQLWADGTMSSIELLAGRLPRLAPPCRAILPHERERKRERELTPLTARRMAAALAGVLPEATAATPGVETAAAQAGKGPVATGQPKKQSGVALRRSAQAALEASSRPVEASRGPFGPLTPKRARTEDLLNKTETQSPLDNVAAGSTGQPTGGLYRPDLCCIAEPMPRPQAEAELAANTTHTPTLAFAAPCVHLSAISGAAAACVSELQAAMTQLASGLGQPAATVCHNPAESAAASPAPLTPLEAGGTGVR